MLKRRDPRQARKVCLMSAICLVLMFGVAYANRYRAEHRLEQEYTIQGEMPRSVKFEEMPQGEAQMTAAMFFRNQGLGRFQECESLVSKDQAEALDLKGREADFGRGEYVQELIVHSFRTLPEAEYGEKKEYYQGRAALLAYEEYRVIRVSYDRKWSEQAKKEQPDREDGTFEAELALGRKGRSWTIFDLSPAEVR